LRTIRQIAAVVAGILLLVLGGTVAAPAALGTAASEITPLANCGATFVPHAGSDAGRVCIQPSTEKDSVTPLACNVKYYQNGPYGSQAWKDGWGICVSVHNDYYYVPSEYNDQASAWDSCSTGAFYANQPATTPAASYPENGAGDFPRGAVPNDSLSSLYVYESC
jgi:hypothetical protein